MSQQVDYRTDFYSLGITFYELITGRLPVSSSDPLEIVHWHLACTPVPPNEVNAQIPRTVSDLVMKLLSKNALRRYQSALGLRADLEHCRRDWTMSQRITPFPLGQSDVPNRFIIPQKLYGRERETEEMLSMFEQASTGEALLVLVAGYSGVGKTSFVQELHRVIAGRHGYFITGKFDQVVRAIPFGAVSRAFDELIDQFLAETEESQHDAGSIWAPRGCPPRTFYYLASLEAPFLGSYS